MPNGNRGRGTRQNGGVVEINWKGKILLGGPLNREDELRDELEERLRDWLDECPMFKASGLSERYAFQIAYSTTYQVPKTGRARDSHGRFVEAPSVIRVIKLDVIYRNPPKGRKWWVRIRDDANTVDPGQLID